MCGVIDNKRTVPADSFIRVMASGDRWPGAGRSGIDFQVCVEIPWNASELLVTLDTSGVVVLDTSHVPEVLGFRTRNADAGGLRIAFGY